MLEFNKGLSQSLPASMRFFRNQILTIDQNGRCVYKPAQQERHNTNLREIQWLHDGIGVPQRSHTFLLRVGVVIA